MAKIKLKEICKYAREGITHKIDITSELHSW